MVLLSNKLSKLKETNKKLKKIMKDIEEYDIVMDEIDKFKEENEKIINEKGRRYNFSVSDGHIYYENTDED